MEVKLVYDEIKQVDYIIQLKSHFQDHLKNDSKTFYFIVSENEEEEVVCEKIVDFLIEKSKRISIRNVAVYLNDFAQNYNSYIYSTLADLLYLANAKQLKESILFLVRKKSKNINFIQDKLFSYNSKLTAEQLNNGSRTNNLKKEYAEEKLEFKNIDLKHYIERHYDSYAFQNALKYYIEQLSLKKGKELKNSDIYKRAGVSKNVFSKFYRYENATHPVKRTIAAFAIALELSIEDAKQLYSTAGYSLSTSSLMDVIVSYYLEKKHYAIDDVNDSLVKYHLGILGERLTKDSEK